MTGDYLRQERIAARDADDAATHPANCTCTRCAAEEVRAGSDG